MIQRKSGTCFAGKWSKLFLWCLTIAWMLLIFGFSAQSGSESSGISQKVSEWVVMIFTDTTFSELPIEQQQQIEFVIRKLAHFSEYAVLGVLFVSLVIVHQKPKAWYGIAAFASLLYAATDEWHQSFTPNRAPALKDVLIDFSGAVTGILFVIVIQYLFAKIRKYLKSRNFRLLQ